MHALFVVAPQGLYDGLLFIRAGEPRIPTMHVEQHAQPGLVFTADRGGGTFVLALPVQRVADGA